MLRPVVRLRERVAVEVVRARRPGTRGRCSRTRCRRRRSFFSKITNGDAGLLQPVGGERCPDMPGADDGDAERRVGGDVVLAPRRRPGVVAVSASSSREQRHVLVGLARRRRGTRSSPEVVVATASGPACSRRRGSAARASAASARALGPHLLGVNPARASGPQRGSGRRSSRRSDRSPVRWATAGRSAHQSASSSARPDGGVVVGDGFRRGVEPQGQRLSRALVGPLLVAVGDPAPAQVVGRDLRPGPGRPGEFGCDCAASCRSGARGPSCRRCRVRYGNARPSGLLRHVLRPERHHLWSSSGSFVSE